MPHETSILEYSHSRSRTLTIFENEGSVWVREFRRVTLKSFQSARTRMRVLTLRILEDSRMILENCPLSHIHDAGDRRLLNIGGAHIQLYLRFVEKIEKVQLLTAKK